MLFSSWSIQQEGGSSPEEGNMLDINKMLAATSNGILISLKEQCAAVQEITLCVLADQLETRGTLHEASLLSLDVVDEIIDSSMEQ
ncbi:MAG: hypothetical protein KZQ77_15545 [Candidatus Thiodiazotropha sp. (ex Notomyrtea botanica)]|nr:hypothetical protein [Candidatus Thiodiazotropha sp. (ex Notomyrtea botanica)]